MSKWIEVDALKKEVENFPSCYNGWSDTYDKAFIISAIEEQPSIKIIRCRECKYRSEASSICDKMNKVMLADDFCSYGERSE